MSYPQMNNDPCESIMLSTVAVPIFRRVTVSSGNLFAMAGKTVRGTHVTEDGAAASATVNARQLAGARQVTILAVSAITRGALVYAAASGKCGTVSTSSAQLGIARNTVSAGEYCVVSPIEQSYNQ